MLRVMDANDARLRETVETVIRRRLPGSDIDRVDARLDEDWEGDPIVAITVVLTRPEVPDAGGMVGMVGELRPALETLGIEHFPIVSYVSRAEAKRLGLAPV